MSILPRREFLTKTTLVNYVADSKTSKDEITKSPICKFKVLHVREPSKIPGLGVLFLTYYFWKKIWPCLFYFKGFKRILQHFKFVNWRICGFIFLMSRIGYSYQLFNLLMTLVIHVKNFFLLSFTLGIHQTFIPRSILIYRVSHMYLNDFVRLIRGHWVT